MPTIPQRRWLIGGAAILVVLALAAGYILMTAAETAPARARVEAAASMRPFGGVDADVANARALADDTPNDPEACSALGFAYLQQARETADPASYGRADEAFQKALDLDDASVNALIGMGTLALARHEFADALELGTRAMELNPTIPRVYGVIGDAQVELGRYEEAVASIQTMVDLRPDLASYSRVAYLREIHGDIEGAIDALELAVSAGGPTAENTEYVRVQLGHLHFARGDLERAEQIYRESLARLPEYPLALGGLARILAAEGEYADAADLYRSASERIPLPEMIIALGETYEAAGDTERAADEYRLVEAMQLLLEANGVRSDLELAAFFAEHGDDPDRALALARDAYAHRPTIFAADVLAWSLYRTGQVAEAAQRADEALRLGTRSSVMLYHAGVIAAAAGDTAIARERLEAALELNPRFSPLLADRTQSALAGLDQ